MRRFATTFALLSIIFTAAACDPYQALQGKVPGNAQATDDLGINAHTLPGDVEPPVAGTPDVNVPAADPIDDR